MSKIASFITKHSNAFLICMLAICVLCAFLIPQVNINTDMTKYLPDDSNMKIGMDIMEEELNVSDTTDIRIMFTGLADTEKEDVLDTLTSISYVDSVDYEADSEDYNSGDYTLYVVNTEYEVGSDEEASIEETLDSEFADYDMVYSNGDDTGSMLPGWLIALALVLLMIILFAMSNSWTEPFLMIATIGIAIVINMGSNIILGTVSDTTYSISAILQLILSMDYSIILMNRYRQELVFNDGDKKAAMQNALKNAFSSVTSSGMTTVVGLLMLIFMSFKIGKDLGLVLAKGVLISMICVFTILPGLILIFHSLIQKTQKKAIDLPFAKLSGGVFKIRKAFIPLFLILFVVAYILQNQAGIAYTLDSEDEIAEIFPESNSIVMLYNNEDEDKIQALADTFEAYDEVDSISSFPTILGKQYTVDEMTDYISDMADDITITAETLSILYYDYFAGDDLPELTVSEFLNLVVSLSEDETFSEYLGDGLSDNEYLEQMMSFSDADILTTQMTAAELAEFFGMDESSVESMLLMYQMSMAGITSSVDISDYSDVDISDYADVDISDYADVDISDYSDIDISDYADIDMSEYADVDISDYTDMDISDYTSSDLSAYLTDTEVTMSIQEFVDFLINYILSDETYAAMFDEETTSSLYTAQTMINLVVEGDTYDASEMAEMFASLNDDLDANTMELLYLYYAGVNDSDSTWTLSPYELFCYLAEDMVNDERFDTVLTDDFREEIADIKAELDDGMEQLKGENYSLLAFSTSFAEEAEETTAFLEALETYANENLSGDYYLIGSSPMAYEMQNGFDAELLQITLLTAIAIFIVVALTFMSVIIPLVLVLIVQCGVYITVSTCGLIGYDIYYLALLIVQCILMGATIDYGILFTNYYRESRGAKGLERKEALAASYKGASHTILTSGLIMILVTGILGLSPGVASTVAQICLTIAIGTTSVVILILFVLPGLLTALDRFVVKKKK